MASELLAVGTTAADSSDVTVASGATLAVALKDAAGPNVEGGARVYISAKDDAGQYFRIATLEGLNPYRVLGPGTYRFSRVAGASCGVFGTEAAVVDPMTSAQFLANLRSTATHSSVNSTASNVTILAANANRKGARIFNTDANALYLDLSGGTAVASSRAQVKLYTDEGFDVPSGLTGAITGIWAADGSGVASVVEFA